jgi:hypothetical protein
VRWDGSRGGEPHMWAKPGRLGPKVEAGGELLCDDDVRLLFYHISYIFIFKNIIFPQDIEIVGEE